MIIDESILNGEVRDELYADVLASNKFGELLYPERVEDAIAALVELAYKHQDSAEIISITSGLTCFFGWNTYKHANQATRSLMTEVLMESIGACDNDISRITLELLIQGTDPALMRAASPHLVRDND